MGNRIAAMFLSLILAFPAFGQLITHPTNIDSLSHWFTPDSIRASLDVDPEVLIDSTRFVKALNLSSKLSYQDAADSLITTSNCVGCDSITYRTNTFQSTYPSWRFRDETSGVSALALGTHGLADEPHYLIQGDATMVFQLYNTGTTTSDTEWFLDFGIVASSLVEGILIQRDNRTSEGNPERYNVTITDAAAGNVVALQSTDNSAIDSTWHNLFVVIDSTGSQEIRLYIDAVQDTSQPFVRALPTTNAGNTLEIGRRTWSGGQSPWRGDVRHVMFYKKALTQDEITGLNNWMNNVSLPTVSSGNIRRRGLHRRAR